MSICRSVVRSVIIFYKRVGSYTSVFLSEHFLHCESDMYDIFFCLAKLQYKLQYELSILTVFQILKASKQRTSCERPPDFAKNTNRIYI